MVEPEMLGDYFPGNEIEEARNHVEVFHGRFLLSDKLGRGDTVLLALYMFCNKNDVADAGIKELKMFATTQLGIDPAIFSKGLSDLRSSEMVSETNISISLSFKGLKKLREMLGLRKPVAVPRKGFQAEAAEIPSIGDAKSVRDAIFRLLSASVWRGRPKTLSEVMDAFEVNALYYPKGTVGTELKRMTSSGILRRIRTKSGFAYILSPKAKAPA